jgi:hypothetical protein
LSSSFISTVYISLYLAVQYHYYIPSSVLVAVKKVPNRGSTSLPSCTYWLLISDPKPSRNSSSLTSQPRTWTCSPLRQRWTGSVKSGTQAPFPEQDREVLRHNSPQSRFLDKRFQETAPLPLHGIWGERGMDKQWDLRLPTSRAHCDFYP